MIEEDRIFDSDTKKKAIKNGIYFYFNFFKMGFICD